MFVLGLIQFNWKSTDSRFLHPALMKHVLTGQRQDGGIGGVWRNEAEGRTGCVDHVHPHLSRANTGDR